MFSINVLVITYNQQDVIGRALDSILQQKEYGLHEIVIGDDCSTDNNWQIIQEYVAKYPGYIRAYRNNPNKGIYGNMEYVLSQRGVADLYMELAGDDSVYDGYFKEIQNFAELHRGEIIDKATVIYGDYQVAHINGNTFVCHNDKVLSSQNAFSLKIRQLISGRSSMATPQVYDRYKPVDLSHGVCLAEELYDCQKQLCSDYNLYLPSIGSTYYWGIGISTTMKSLKFYKEQIYKYEHIAEYIDLIPQDYYYMRYQYFFYKFIAYRNILDIFKCRWYHYKGIMHGIDNTFIHDVHETAYMIKLLFYPKPA